MQGRIEKDNKTKIVVRKIIAKQSKFYFDTHKK